ncbi:MAG: hypothetical protein ACR2PX_12530 [Endozoicomonas sp.]|uniref:hypothetical protein n=1 Tax=Endozoicomonas sp. TaxID=1892382 RepID=UPI003D9BED39
MKFVLWGIFLIEFLLFFLLLVRKGPLKLTDRFFSMVMLLNMVHLVMNIASISGNNTYGWVNVWFLTLQTLEYPVLFLITRQLISPDLKLNTRDIHHFLPVATLILISLEGNNQTLNTDSQLYWILPATPLSQWATILFLMTSISLYIGYQWVLLKNTFPEWLHSERTPETRSSLRWIFIFCLFSLTFSVLILSYYIGLVLYNPGQPVDASGAVYSNGTDLSRFPLVHIESTSL